jgi:hypothetical protein
MHQPVATSWLTCDPRKDTEARVPCHVRPVPLWPFIGGTSGQRTVSPRRYHPTAVADEKTGWPPLGPRTRRLPPTEEQERPPMPGRDASRAPGTVTHARLWATW